MIHCIKYIFLFYIFVIHLSEEVDIMDAEKALFKECGWIRGPWTSCQPVFEVENIYEEYTVTSWCHVHKILPIEPIISALLKEFKYKVDSYEYRDYFSIGIHHSLGLMSRMEACQSEWYSPITMGRDKDFETVIAKFRIYN